MEAGVKDKLQVGGVGHLGDKLVLVHHLRDVESLLAEHLAQLLPPLQPLVLVGQVDDLQAVVIPGQAVARAHLDPDRPDLPGDVLRGEGPPGPPPLEELQRDLAGPEKEGCSGMFGHAGL